MTEQTIRTQMLLGEAARLRACVGSRVAVLGSAAWAAGAPRRWPAPASVRSRSWTGDTVSEQPQLPVLRAALYDRPAEGGRHGRACVHDIDPTIAVDARTERYEAATQGAVFQHGHDYIADCIDLVSCKVDLIRTAHAPRHPIVSASAPATRWMRAGLSFCDISRTSGCPFARVMRRELRSAGITHHAVVFSPEPAMTPEALRRRRAAGACPACCRGCRPARGLLLAQKIVLDLCAAPEKRA